MTPWEYIGINISIPQEHKTSWAKMALASKDEMKRLAAELKEKEEQEKMMKQRLSTRPQAKPQGTQLILFRN